MWRLLRYGWIRRPLNEKMMGTFFSKLVHAMLVCGFFYAGLFGTIFGMVLGNSCACCMATYIPCLTDLWRCRGFMNGYFFSTSGRLLSGIGRSYEAQNVNRGVPALGKYIQSPRSLRRHNTKTDCKRMAAYSLSRS